MHDMNQSLHGSTALPVLAIFSITSSCVTLPFTVTFCVSRFTSYASTPGERGAGAVSGVSGGRARPRAGWRVGKEGRAREDRAPTRARPGARSRRAFHLPEHALDRARAPGAHHRHLEHDRGAHPVGSWRGTRGGRGARASGDVVSGFAGADPGARRIASATCDCFGSADDVDDTLTVKSRASASLPPFQPAALSERARPLAPPRARSPGSRARVRAEAPGMEPA